MAIETPGAMIIIAVLFVLVAVITAVSSRWRFLSRKIDSEADAHRYENELLWLRRVMIWITVFVIILLSATLLMMSLDVLGLVWEIIA